MEEEEVVKGGRKRKICVPIMAKLEAPMGDILYLPRSLHRDVGCQ